MKRSPLRRSTGEARAELPILKQRKCKGCGESFRPWSSTQTACGRVCAQAIVDKNNANKAERARLEESRRRRAQREALKTIPQLKKEAQREFNRYIRIRDRLAGFACICCGEPLRLDVPGGAADAGHYRSTGSADHLRFNEDNCHAQRSICNRYGAGRAVDYRVGLVARIGLDRVKALEENNNPVKWTRELLREIRNSYRRKAKELEKS